MMDYLLGKDKYRHNAALLPVLFKLYNGYRVEVDSWEAPQMAGIRRIWARLAYNTAEWCNEDRIRLGALYSAIPAYYPMNDDGDRKEYVLGFDLLCGDIVELGRIRNVVAHEDHLDLMLPTTSISIFFDTGGMPLSTHIRYCADTIFGSNVLPPYIGTGAMSPMRLTYEFDNKFIYNIEGRAMSLRMVAMYLGVREDSFGDVTPQKVYNTIVGFKTLPMARVKRAHSNLAFERIYENDRQTRIEASAMGVSRSHIRIPVVTNTKGVVGTRCLMSQDFLDGYVCEGIGKPLVSWGAELHMNPMILKQAWVPGLTREQWVQRANDIITPPVSPEARYRMRELAKRTRHIDRMI